MRRLAIGGLEDGVAGVADGQQDRLGGVVGDVEHSGDFSFEEREQRGPGGAESAGTEGEHERPGGGEDRSVEADLAGDLFRRPAFGTDED